MDAPEDSELRRTESLLKAQNHALELIASGVPLREMLNVLARLIEEQSGGQSIVSIFLVSPDRKHLVVGAAPSLPDDFNRAVDGIEIRAGLGTCADAAARAAVTITPDIAAAAGWKGLAHLPEGQGLLAAWSMPIMSSTGRVLGTVGTYFRERREPTERERQVVEVLCRTADDQAKENIERMELVVSGAQVGVWYCPLPFDTLIWDDRVKEHFHLPPSATVTIDTFYERLHPDDRERTRAAIESSIEAKTGYDIDYRTVSPDGTHIKWIRAVGRAFYGDDGKPIRFDGITGDITRRKVAEEALRISETQFRELAEVRRKTAETLSRHVATLASLSAVNLTLASATDVETIVQTATDHGTTTTGAAFGAFFYNVVKPSGEQYMLYTLSGVSRSAFEQFPMPRNTAVFSATFSGEGVVRSPDITLDPRYGKNAPRKGMPEGHLPVRSYLAVPVKSRTGAVIGGLFFGHPDFDVFDEESERFAVGVAAQAAIALDNAHLYSDLRRSEHRYALAARATNDAIWDWDLASGNVGWNQAIADLFGHHDALQGTKADWWLQHVHPDDRTRVHDRIRAAIADSSASPWQDEYRFARADGSWADVFDRGAVLRDAAGVAVRMVGAMQDLSERKHSERERQQLLERERSARATAENAGRLKDEFLATLSHELRTPLNAILGWTHILRKGSEDRERTLRGIDVIERNARVQTQLISDLLDISRITSGKMRLDVQRVELPLVIEAALESVRPAADAKGVRVQTVIEPISEPVHGDPNRLQQIVWNLLSNAVKFTPKGGRVQIVLARVNSHVEMVVSDTGEGVAPEFLPHMFERFRQADASASREHTGLGLGLALVKQLVEMHGGKVSAASAGIGQGATFIVELPLAIIHRAEETLRTHPRTFVPPPVLEQPRLRGLRVLVVDDERDALEMVQQVLADYGAVVTTAASADEALKILQKEKFDALLSDIGMPRRDGYEFIAAVRRDGHRIPAAALTAFARSEDRTRALLAGYQAHVTKPVEPAELLATIVSLTREPV